jgi:hypothetical protein
MSRRASFAASERPGPTLPQAGRTGLARATPSDPDLSRRLPRGGGGFLTKVPTIKLHFENTPSGSSHYAIDKYKSGSSTPTNLSVTLSQSGGACGGIGDAVEKQR